MKTPGWGKAIGIIMIILGSLGIFYQIYKIAAPSIFELQQEMMSEISNEIEFNNEFEEDNIRIRPDRVFKTIQDKLRLTNVAHEWLPVFGIIGILFCIYYIIGGALLLKAKPINYKIALSALGGMIALNIFSYTVLFSEGMSLMLLGLLIYSFVGVAVDIALFIIFIASDKSKYGIGKPQEYKGENKDQEDYLI